ncbi:hypothetical protein J4444_01245 [Candidatus Woesearchaeota archaeon]|nr:hypothetical protein [Candidatus Woesearchaeota archaeon]
MNQIIKAQGKHKKISLGKYTHEVKTSKHGTITEIDNEIIAKIARIAGAPEDKGAGLYLHKKVGDKVHHGDTLFTVYAENKFKYHLAEDFLRKNKGYVIS